MASRRGEGQGKGVLSAFRDLTAPTRGHEQETCQNDLPVRDGERPREPKHLQKTGPAFETVASNWYPERTNESSPGLNCGGCRRGPIRGHARPECSRPRPFRRGEGRVRGRSVLGSRPCESFLPACEQVGVLRCEGRS